MSLIKIADALKNVSQPGLRVAPWLVIIATGWVVVTTGNQRALGEYPILWGALGFLGICLSVHLLALCISGLYFLSSKGSATLNVRAMGWRKIPVIGYVQPEVTHLDKESCTICIPLSRRTKNHLNSMYLGVLSVGADLAGGLMAMETIQTSGHPISLVFKDMQAEFVRRAEGDVHFSCHEGAAIRNLVEEAIRTGERVSQTFKVDARVPGEPDTPVVARFAMTLSLKRKH